MLLHVEGRCVSLQFCRSALGDALFSRLRDAASEALGVPDTRELRWRFTEDGRPLASHDSSEQCLARGPRIIRAELAGGLPGGKGGFGANLKSSGKSATPVTTDFSMCRDLYGRRLGAVNNEIRLRKWMSRDVREPCSPQQRR